MSIPPQAARSPSILVVDRIDHNRRSIIEALPPHQFSCIEASDGLTAWNRYLSDRPRALLSAVDLRGLASSELLTRVRTHSSAAIAFHSTVNDARLAASFMRAGADDFFIIPEEVPTIASRLNTILARNTDLPLRDAVQATIVGHSRPTARLREQIIGVAALRIPVFLHGEAGSGSDHLAQTIASLTFDLPHSLIPIRRGSSRPPQRSDLGKVVYLDHVESLSLSDQAQWSNQIKKCERGDADAPHRVIASSSADLHQLALIGRFDPNLAQRLVQFAIEIPPLRHRLEDIPALARHLASRVSLEMGRPRIVLTAPALRLLQQRPWPGNVRELRVVIEKLVAFAVDGRITRDSVDRVLSEAPCGVKSMRISHEQKLRDELIAILDTTGGNLAEAARRMNMSRGAVIYRAQKFGLLAKRMRAGA